MFPKRKVESSKRIAFLKKKYQFSLYLLINQLEISIKDNESCDNKEHDLHILDSVMGKREMTGKVIQ